MQPFLFKRRLLIKRSRISSKNRGKDQKGKQKISAMKTKIITSVTLLLMTVVTLQGQSKKAETSVMNFSSYKLWVPGLDEFVKGAFRIEQTLSDNLEEFVAVGRGIGQVSLLEYDIESQFSYKYHGKDKKSYKFNQETVVMQGGTLLIRISKMYQVSLDDTGAPSIRVEKEDVSDYR